jgi:glycosyltransferase involved in cell wall biosynthesis
LYLFEREYAFERASNSVENRSDPGLITSPSVMRLAYVNARFRPGANDGANAHIRQFVTHAVGTGHELWMDRREAHPLAKTLPGGTLPRNLKLREMDVIYVRVEHHLPKIVRNATPFRRWLYGNPIWAWEFNTVPEYGVYSNLGEEEIQNEIARFKHFGRWCDLAVCVSQRLSQYVRDQLGIRRTLVAPNGSDPDLFRPDIPARPLAQTAGAFNVLWMGSAFVGWHDFDLLCDAAILIHERGNPLNIHFHLLGGGLTSLGNIPPNVQYHGPQDYEHLPAWMNAMDVGLCLYRPGPADYSSPLKVFDYLMSGLCVVASDQPQCREIFSQLNQTDLLVSRDPQRLAQTLEALASNRDRAKLLGQKGRGLALAQYTWEQTVKAIFNELENLRAAR